MNGKGKESQVNRLGNSAEEYQEHYVAALALIEGLHVRHNVGPAESPAEVIALAQIHATLAVAVATARTAYIIG